MPLGFTIYKVSLIVAGILIFILDVTFTVCVITHKKDKQESITISSPVPIRNHTKRFKVKTNQVMTDIESSIATIPVQPSFFYIEQSVLPPEKSESNL